MPRRLPDLNEPRMQVLLDHLRTPDPLRSLVRCGGQYVMRAFFFRGATTTTVDVQAYTFAEVKFAKAHLTVIGHA